MPTVADIAAFLETFAPPALAADWDNVGLLLGDSSATVQRLMTCLTVTPQSATEAIEADAQMIVSHHPIFFRPVQSLTTQNAESSFLWQLARAGVAVFSPHTAFDNTKGGINDILARRLALTDIVPLRASTGPQECKIAVFVPESDLVRVSDIMFAAGAGNIGEYRECSFRVTGTGTFFGSENANPTIGQKGRREEVTEWRLEVVCPAAKIAPVLQAMRKAHSYEEPAFDIYPLQPKPSALGQGRLGRLMSPLPLGELARQSKTVLNARLVQVSGDHSRMVQSVALACGAAGEYLVDAFQAKADVFLTGELRFHEILAAQTRGLSLILPGHFATERVGIEEMAAIVDQQFPDITAWASRTESDALGVIG